MEKFNSFNDKLALILTKAVGSMVCAYLFCLLALISLPASIATKNPLIIVAWTAQTFLQLVLLSIIMVGQDLKGAESEKKLDQILDKIYADEEEILKDIKK